VSFDIFSSPATLIFSSDVFISEWSLESVLYGDAELFVTSENLWSFDFGGGRGPRRDL